MLTLDQYEFIRTAHRVYKKNISELSRMTGHSRNTVKKAIRGEPWGYRERAKQPFPVLSPYLTMKNRKIGARRKEISFFAWPLFFYIYCHNSKIALGSLYFTVAYIVLKFFDKDKNCRAKAAFQKRHGFAQSLSSGWLEMPDFD